MIIKNLRINGFSLFDSKIISLKNGLNIVYGPNESGKSSTFMFIKAMFYGFVKEGKLTKQYSPEYEKYLPWNIESFSGSLEFLYAGNEYILERNFLKSKESVRLLDARTGEDITSTLPFDQVAKVHSPGAMLSIDKEMFENVCQISVGDTTTSQLPLELSKSFSAFSMGGTASSDVAEALSILAKKKNEIGSPRQNTKPYAMENVRLSGLKKEYDASMSVYEENKGRLYSINEFSKRNEELKKELAMAKAEIETNITLTMQSKYDELILLENAQSLLEDKLNNSSISGSITNDDYSEYVNLCAKIKANEEQIGRLNERLNANNNLIALHNKTLKNYEKQNIISADLETFGYDELTLAKLTSRPKPQKPNQMKINELEEDMGYHSKHSQTFTILAIILAILGLGTGFSGWYFKQALLYGACGVLFIGAITLGILAKKASDEVNQKKETYAKLYSEISLANRLIEEYEQEKNALLKKYECQSFEQAKEKITQTKATYKDIASLKSSILGAKQTKKEIEDSLASLLGENQMFEKHLNEIYKKGNVSRDADVEQVFLASGGASLTREKLSNIKEKISAILSSYSRKDLEESASLPRIQNYSALDNSSIKATIDELNNLILINEGQIQKLSSLCRAASEKVRNPSEIREDILNSEKKIKQYKLNYEALEKAEVIINDCSKNIHRSIAPRLSASVSSWVEFVTMGKYSDVKIDDSLTMRAFDKKSAVYVEVSKLSSGTIDQFYLSLKLAIADLLDSTGEPMPLFLDDSFLQYDDERLKNTLITIERLSTRRQIILFAATKRETTFLVKNKLPVNIVAMEGTK